MFLLSLSPPHPPAVPVETAPPGVTPGAEGGLRLGPAPAPLSPLTPALHRAPAPAAALAPTHDPGPNRDGQVKAQRF